MSVAVAMPDKTASTVARALVDRWIAIFGISITLLSENNLCVARKFFQVLTKVLGVKHVFTSTYPPTTMGRSNAGMRRWWKRTGISPSGWPVFLKILPCIKLPVSTR
jgi:hypothetical protein